MAKVVKNKGERSKLCDFTLDKKEKKEVDHSEKRRREKRKSCAKKKREIRIPYPSADGTPQFGFYPG